MPEGPGAQAQWTWRAAGGRGSLDVMAATTRAHRVAGAALVGLGLSVVALGVAPAVMAASYSWVADTTSESAAQGIDGAWLARLGFLLFGLAVMALAFVSHDRWGAWAASLHYAFGALLAAAAAFSTRPPANAPYDHVEDALHSVAATTMGFAFAAGVLATVLARHHAAGRTGVRARVHAHLIDAVAVAASVVVPLSMTALPGAAGALQRAMFLIAYAWYGAQAVRLVRAPAGKPDPSRGGRRSAGAAVHR